MCVTIKGRVLKSGWVRHIPNERTLQQSVFGHLDCNRSRSSSSTPQHCNREACRLIGAPFQKKGDESPVICGRPTRTHTTPTPTTKDSAAAFCSAPFRVLGIQLSNYRTRHQHLLLLRRVCSRVHKLRRILLVGPCLPMVQGSSRQVSQRRVEALEVAFLTRGAVVPI